MIDAIIQLFNKPKIYWTAADGLLYDAVIIGGCLILALLFVGVRLIAHEVKKRQRSKWREHRNNKQ